MHKRSNDPFKFKPRQKLPMKCGCYPSTPKNMLLGDVKTSLERYLDEFDSIFNNKTDDDFFDTNIASESKQSVRLFSPSLDQDYSQNKSLNSKFRVDPEYLEDYFKYIDSAQTFKTILPINDQAYQELQNRNDHEMPSGRPFSTIPSRNHLYPEQSFDYHIDIGGRRSSDEKIYYDPLNEEHRRMLEKLKSHDQSLNGENFNKPEKFTLQNLNPNTNHKNYYFQNNNKTPILPYLSKLNSYRDYYNLPTVDNKPQPKTDLQNTDLNLFSNSNLKRFIHDPTWIEFISNYGILNCCPKCREHILSEYEKFKYLKNKNLNMLIGSNNNRAPPCNCKEANRNEMNNWQFYDDHIGEECTIEHDLNDFAEFKRLKNSNLPKNEKRNQLSIFEKYLLDELKKINEKISNLENRPIVTDHDQNFDHFRANNLNKIKTECSKCSKYNKNDDKIKSRKNNKNIVNGKQKTPCKKRKNALKRILKMIEYMNQNKDDESSE